MIDFIMLSSSLSARVSAPPRLYAFDQDEEIGGCGIELSDYRYSGPVGSVLPIPGSEPGRRS